MLKITFTERFNKHFRSLTVNEKKLFKNKLSIFSEIPLHPSLRTKRIQGTEDLFEFRSIWISVSSGFMRVILWSRWWISTP